MGPRNDILPKEINNILVYQRNKYLKSFPNEISFIQHTFGNDLISLQFSAYSHPFFIVAKREGLRRLAYVENVCLDKTHSKSNEGIYVLSEKISYDFNKGGEDKRKRGRRCLAWVYIFTKSQDQYTIKLILSIIKFNVENVSGIEWKPQQYYNSF